MATHQKYKESFAVANIQFSALTELWLDKHMVLGSANTFTCSWHSFCRFCCKFYFYFGTDHLYASFIPLLILEYWMSETGQE